VSVLIVLFLLSENQQRAAVRSHRNAQCSAVHVWTNRQTVTVLCENGVRPVS